MIRAAHDEQLALHGGPEGVRDAGLMQSALGRAPNLAAYGEPDAADLAATYAFGIARNHPFVDGNKRTAAVAAITFLEINRIDYEIGEAELVVMILALAAGELLEVEVAEWFRARISD